MKEPHLFEAVYALLDSDQPGEAAAALTKIHQLRDKHSWPRFGDLLRPFTDTVPIAQFRKVESDLAARMREVLMLRAALGGIKNIKFAAVAVAVLGLGYAGYRAYAPDAKAASAAPKIASALLTDMKAFQRWPGPEAEGDAAPMVRTIAGQPYWIVVRNEIDRVSHSDANGKPLTRHCQRYFAAEAQWDTATPPSWLTPHPYGLFGLGPIKWPEAAAQCR